MQGSQSYEKASVGMLVHLAAIHRDDARQNGYQRTNVDGSVNLADMYREGN